LLLAIQLAQQQLHFSKGRRVTNGSAVADGEEQASHLV
jgi:hypothetical protein